MCEAIVAHRIVDTNVNVFYLVSLFHTPVEESFFIIRLMLFTLFRISAILVFLVELLINISPNRLKTIENLVIKLGVYPDSSLGHCIFGAEIRFREIYFVNLMRSIIGLVKFCLEGTIGLNIRC